MAGITAGSYRRIKVEIDLSQAEAIDLANAVYEATGYVDNWRSDPRLLIELADKLRKVAT